jgi:hypothetical protein
MRMRRVGLMLAVLLHGAIILVMGLFSFGLIMITLLLVVCADAGTERAAGQVRTGVRVGDEEVSASAA